MTLDCKPSPKFDTLSVRARNLRAHRLCMMPCKQPHFQIEIFNMMGFKLFKRIVVKVGNVVDIGIFKPLFIIRFFKQLQSSII